MSTVADSDINNENQILTIDYVKGQKEITDNLDDIRLAQLVFTSIDEITNRLLPIIDVNNLAGTKFFSKARKQAYKYFNALYLRQINKAYQEADLEDKAFETSMEKLIESIKAEPSISKRSQGTTVGASYESPLLFNVPGYTDRFGNRIDNETRTR